MEVMRLVITGPVGAGKSTFIRSVSEIEAVDTDRWATDEAAALKSKTTVALDFGRLQFTPEMALHLYGTPGQSRFDFMWDVLIRLAHAYILLVPANRPAAFRNAKLIYRFMSERVAVPMLVGITHADCEDAWAVEDIAIALGFTHPRPPFVSLNAMEAQSVTQTLMTLVSHCLQTV
ncbi:MAG: GTPase [Leptolyngbya sp. SIO4C1]|nr:GTPase [Leptolyngbya sp. SIO4C1]